MRKQQSVFSHSRKINDAAVKASYLIVFKIASASKLYFEGKFVKTCMLKVAEIVCPAKRQASANISLTRNSVAERILDLAGDLDSQIKDKVKSLAIDKSTDITDAAQLAIFIRGVESLVVTEELLEFVPMTDTTTANDIFNSLIGALDRVRVDWACACEKSTGCKWRAQFLDFSLYFAPGGIVLQVIKNGSCHGSGCPNSSFHPSQRSEPSSV